MNRIRLTDAGVRRFKPGVREYTVRDTRVPSLRVRVHPSGTRTFVCHLPDTKKSLGPVTLRSVEEARRECLTLQAEGTNRKAAAPVFATFTTGPWRASWLSRCKRSTIRGRDRILNTQLVPNFGKFCLDRITPAHVHRWFDDYSRTSPGAANAALKLLRQVFNHAVKLEHIAHNPARGVRANPRPKRTRFLSLDEIDRLNGALDRHAGGRRGRQADIIRLLLLTGCRKNEIVRLRRREAESGCLKLEDSKTGPRTVFLNRRASEIVECRMATTSGEFMFPSPRDPARPISDNLPLWDTVRQEAGIENVRLHDLRHNYASRAVMQGVPLPVVAQLLGHSQVTMTLLYAHTCDREIEAASERIGATISERIGFPVRRESARNPQRDVPRPTDPVSSYRRRNGCND